MMKNLIFLFTFLSISFLACNNPSTETSEADKQAAISDQKEWKAFWSKFEKAVAQNNIGAIVELAQLPLRGNFFDDEKGDGLSRAGLVRNYAKIFEANTVQRIANVKPNEMGEIVTKTENDEKYIGVPIGTKAKILRFEYVFNKGKSNQTESTQMFYFAKFNGEYKWCSMLIAG